MASINTTGREDISLDKATMHLLEECRMVLPGIQMTFGFQLIVFFNETFRHLLTAEQRLLHLAAMTGVALAAALVMTPAALHRHVEPLEVSHWLIRVGSRLLMWGMFPLAIGLCMDLYLLCSTVTTSTWSIAYAVMMFIVFISLWFLVPVLIKRRRQTR